MKVLITGGAGYIGSNISSVLLDNGHTPVIIDNFVNGRREFVDGRILYEGDIADSSLIRRIKSEHPEIDSCVHCAALIIVPESMENPYEYYTDNVTNSIKFFKTLSEIGINKILFSSSASIYDDVDDFIVTEESLLNPRSPYAKTKYIMEMALEDFCRAYHMQGISLRYFNPIGNDPKLRSGVYDKDPSHVLDKMLLVAEGRADSFTITGTDWNTRDGSGLRDYIHLWDLAEAHLAALLNFDSIFEGKSGYEVINIGRGEGITVKELLTSFERVYGHKLNLKYSSLRPGDVQGCYASADKAKEKLKWTARFTVDEAIESALNWIKNRGEVLKDF